MRVIGKCTSDNNSRISERGVKRVPLDYQWPKPVMAKHKNLGLQIPKIRVCTKNNRYRVGFHFEGFFSVTRRRKHTNYEPNSENFYWKYCIKKGSHKTSCLVLKRLMFSVEPLLKQLFWIFFVFRLRKGRQNEP